MEACNLRRRRGERVDEARQRQHLVAHELEQNRQAQLEADHSRRSRRELAVLLELGVRRVIGRDAIDRAVGERRAERIDVFTFAQRRVHFARGVVAEDRIVREHEVMRRDLGRRADAARFGLAEEAHRAERRHVRDVITRPRVLGEEQIARHDDVFGDARPATKPEPRRDPALVHLGTLGERVILGVLNDGQVERARVLERAAHHGARRHAAAVVGDPDDPSVFELGHFGERFALLADGDGANRMQARAAERARTLDEHRRDCARVVHRFGVRHRAHIDEPAGRRGAEGRRHVLFVLMARLAHVRVQIDHARKQPRARVLDDAHVLGRRGRDERRRGIAADARDRAALHDDVHFGVELSAGIDGANAAKNESVDAHRPQYQKRPNAPMLPGPTYGVIPALTAGAGSDFGDVTRK